MTSNDSVPVLTFCFDDKNFDCMTEYGRVNRYLTEKFGYSISIRKARPERNQHLVVHFLNGYNVLYDSKSCGGIQISHSHMKKIKKAIKAHLKEQAKSK